MKKIHVFTSAACNYIPKVRLLLESVRRHHPEWVFHLAVSDYVESELDLSAEGFDEIHTADRLGIPGFPGWAFCHSIVELSTAIKPFVVAELLRRDDCAGVMYIDPDIVLFSRLDDIVELMGSSNVVLTPHQMSPETGLQSIIDNEICSLQHGIYNLGFVGVSNTVEGKAFAKWWSDRLYYFCRADIPNGLFTDQRWIDLAPVFFKGVEAVPSRRHNVAPWNLTTRRVEGEFPNFTVNDEPLGFYHFTGFDSGAHRIMSRRNSDGNLSVAQLVDWYRKSTALLVDDPLSNRPWAYGAYSDGRPIAKEARAVFRQRQDLQRAFPNPFDTTDGGFAQWWDSQGRLDYPELFESETAAAGLQRLTVSLTPGYTVDDWTDPVDFPDFGQHVRNGLASRTERRRLTRRAVQVFRSEGLAGIGRRVRHR